VSVKIKVGDRVTWRYATKKLGVLELREAIVLKVGPKRVQIEFSKQDGFYTTRWVTPDNLTIWS
jgi:hypothetical protein